MYYIADQTETIFYSELLGSSGKQTYTFNFTYHFEGWQYFGFYYGKFSKLIIFVKTNLFKISIFDVENNFNGAYSNNYKYMSKLNKVQC